MKIQYTRNKAPTGPLFYITFCLIPGPRKKQREMSAFEWALTKRYGVIRRQGHARCGAEFLAPRHVASAAIISPAILSTRQSSIPPLRIDDEMKEDATRASAAKKTGSL
jgi:hypothetical protein